MRTAAKQQKKASPAHKIERIATTRTAFEFRAGEPPRAVAVPLANPPALDNPPAAPVMAHLDTLHAEIESVLLGDEEWDEVKVVMVHLAAPSADEEPMPNPDLLPWRAVDAALARMSRAN